MEKKKDSIETMDNIKNIRFPSLFKIGDKCIAVQLEWSGVGNIEYPLHRIDVEGIITSTKDTPGHSNIHKYEFTWEGGRFYTDNKRNELIDFKNRTPEEKKIIRGANFNSDFI